MIERELRNILFRRRKMKLKNVLIVVKDIERSKKFYRDLFGLEVVLDSGENVILTEGLVLQEESLWKETIHRELCSKHNKTELYFTERDMEHFLEKLQSYEDVIEYVTPLTRNSWGRQVVRFYDLDGNLIEVAGEE